MRCATSCEVSPAASAEPCRCASRERAASSPEAKSDGLDAEAPLVGKEMRGQRVRLKQQHHAQRAGWRSKQDANHELRQAARVTTEEVHRETVDSASGYNPILQFFGFRKRGGPDKASYRPSYGGGEEVRL